MPITPSRKKHKSGASSDLSGKDGKASDKRSLIPTPEDERQEAPIPEQNERASDDEEFEDAEEFLEAVTSEDTVTTTVSDGKRVAEEAHNMIKSATQERLDIGVEEWQNNMGQAIERLSVFNESDMSRLDRILTNLWQDLQERPCYMKVGLDKFINDKLTPGILGADLASQRNKALQIRGPDRDRERPNHNRRTGVSYARCQELFENCPRRLADAAISGCLEFMEYRQDKLNSQEIKDLYKDLWRIKAPVLYKCEVKQAAELQIFIPPITENDVPSRIGTISSGSAAGPDLIKKVHLGKKDLPIVLAKLFNLLIVTGHYSEPWKENRTTLIPKAGKDGSNVRNWRPITVGSMLGILFAGIIDMRLPVAIMQNAGQKGFTSMTDVSKTL